MSPNAGHGMTCARCSTAPAVAPALCGPCTASELWLALEDASVSGGLSTGLQDVVALDDVAATFRRYCGGTLPRRTPCPTARASETVEGQS